MYVCNIVAMETSEKHGGRSCCFPLFLKMQNVFCFFFLNHQTIIQYVSMGNFCGILSLTMFQVLFWICLHVGKLLALWQQN